jgi:hypothetical protein
MFYSIGPWSYIWWVRPGAYPRGKDLIYSDEVKIIFVKLTPVLRQSDTLSRHLVTKKIFLMN